MLRFLFFFVTLYFTANHVFAEITLQDILRGSINANRNWWDVLHYNIQIEPDISQKKIVGKVKLKFKVVKLIEKDFPIMQIDLQEPMQIDSVVYFDQNITYNLHTERDKNIYLITFNSQFKFDAVDSIEIFFSGKPQEAKNAPWDGGLIWSQDKKKRPFISVACQGKGASVWLPCKDHQSDEPNEGIEMTIIHSDTLIAVGNGQKISEENIEGNKTKTSWRTNSPINSYNIVFYLGKYVQYYQKYVGIKGILACNYYVIDYNIRAAKKQFKDAPKMLQAFEDWFGAYPFYNDGYKLVEAPFLGMEHQSAVAYGNNFKNGYRGRDLSGSGWGKKFDYIIIHESAHEWWGNNITTNDIADMWVHEAFAMFAEVLFVDYYYGKKASTEYCTGVRSKIMNDKPIIGEYGINQEGSGDMYYKGANMVQCIRAMLNDDEKFKSILISMQQDFALQQVNTETIETYLEDKTGLNLKPIFNQYLRTTNIPELQFKFLNEKTVQCKLTNCNSDFEIPMRLPFSKNEFITHILKADAPVEINIKGISKNKFREMLDANYFVYYEEM